MKRVVKFRGKTTDTNEWVYGNLVVDTMTGNKMAIIDWADMSEEKKDGGAYVWNDVIPESVSQYVGLQDILGKEIYEIDIVKGGKPLPLSGSMPHNKVKLVSTGSMVKVLHHDGNFKMSKSNDAKNFHLNSLTIRLAGLTVVGNTFDNPELLTKNKPN